MSVKEVQKWKKEIKEKWNMQNNSVNIELIYLTIPFPIYYYFYFYYGTWQKGEEMHWYVIAQILVFFFFHRVLNSDFL